MMFSNINCFRLLQERNENRIKKIKFQIVKLSDLQKYNDLHYILKFKKYVIYRYFFSYVQFILFYFIVTCTGRIAQFLIDRDLGSPPLCAMVHLAYYIMLPAYTVAKQIERTHDFLADESYGDKARLS